MLKSALPPTRNPNASQWNIGCVGSPGIGAGAGHVRFMLFVSISFALGSQHECSFQWNMGLTQLLKKCNNAPPPLHFMLFATISDIVVVRSNDFFCFIIGTTK